MVSVNDIAMWRGESSSRMWTDLFWACAGAFLLTFAFPRPALGLLAWVGLVPLIVISLTSAPIRAFRVGYLTGVLHFLALLRWVIGTIHQYGGVPWIAGVAALLLLCLYLGAYLGVFAWGLSRWRRGGFFSLLFAPVLWVALEYLRTMALTGFPWGLLGYTQQNSLALIQVVDVTGVYGLSFLVVLVNTALALCVVPLADRESGRCGWGAPVLGMAVAAACVGAAFVYGTHRMAQVDEAQGRATTLKVGVVQGNIDQAVKWDGAYQFATLETYRRLSAEALKQKPDLVVWPETATPFYYLNPVDGVLTREVNRGLAQGDADWILGAPAAERAGQGWRYFNRAYAVTSEGAVIGSYDKVHLVPFGEYIPFQDLLFFVKRLVASAGNFSAGTKGDTIKGWDWQVGVQICFESIFPELSVASVRSGAGLLVNLTNDAWFGRSGAPFQHFQMARFRAVETRRALARSANTGISGFVDPVGRVTGATQLYEEAWRVASLPVMSLTSLYVRFGDLFAWVCAGLALLMGPVIGGVRRRNP
ncbi:apolipoprotein N-acyltransferase [Desulfoluna spongiiphila]|uniref:apolipoprotein N-acyltransferase n=1 Tax=Desulfoluna spongiiphila TaxID=419481 RepID=UPI0012551C1B|nr:apolipoprotein N-acyltransferase [Desulfoluna spongiiphila]VVS92272.1 apolipoprotein n-acyltransferase [Desulfoluna spongiiphila]